MNLYKNILKTLILAPYLFAFSGMLIIPNGDKKMAIFLVVGSLASLCFAKINKISLKERLLNPYLIIIILATFYSIFSYYTHGASSREMRALIATAIFLAVFPFKKISSNLLIAILLLGSLILFINSFYYHHLLGQGRLSGYINPIPYATICALIGSVAYSLMLSSSSVKEKWICSLPLLIIIYPLIISESRGVWIALIISIIVVSFTYVKSKGITLNKMIILLTSFSIISIGSLFLFKDNIEFTIKKTQQEINQMESGVFDNSIGLRFKMWLIAPKLIEKNMLLGSGDSHQLEIKKLYDKGEVSYSLYNFNPTHYHNQFLDKLIKSGIIGLVILISLMAYPIKISNKLSERGKTIIFGVTSLIFIASLSDVPLNHPQPLILYFLLLFPICSRCKRVTND
ncbi:O-antigen ligase [Vibrio splendidus]|uniref:O-antigen ligase family protein n=1 Tax=Vibrio splendidus TaxID=29497 RepID=UPI000D3B3C6E|nr:O-antigen ligase family protein [Vibrio splendidus]PTO86857.1 O-antigen ligase [Vibrio splendidus]PTP47497.1 O-antigen ligase [Vibrio splendidus]